MARQRHSFLNRLLFGVALLVLATTLMITRWGFHSPISSAGPESQTDTASAPVDQRLIFAAGVVEGLGEPLDVQFEVPGRIRRVLVQEGQKVRKDDVLAELEPELFELAVNMAEADLRMAQLQSQNLETVQATGSDETGTVRQASLPRSTKATEQLMATSRVEHAELALQREQIQLQKAQVHSPMDGTVVECVVRPGEVVPQFGNSAAFRIVDRTKTRVRAWIEELDAMDVHPGLSAAVVASGSVDRKFRGTVISCAGYVQPKAERHLNPGERLDVRVREIVVELKDGEELLLGLPVEVFIARSRGARTNRVDN